MISRTRRISVQVWSLAIALILSPFIEAQDIQWSRPHLIVGIDDISKRGFYVDAVQTYLREPTVSIEIGEVTIGDTVFHKARPNAEGGGDGIIAFCANRGGASFASGKNPGQGWNVFPTDPPSSADYSTVVSNGIYIRRGDDNDGAVTLSQLKIGHAYEVQVWLFVQDHEHSLTTLSGKNSVTLDNEAGNLPHDGLLPSGAYGNYALGTFTATGPIEKFTWSPGSNGGRFAAISSIALRDITGIGGIH